MNDWRSALRGLDDPAARMEDSRAAGMREVVVRAARTAPVPASPWGMRIALAGFAVLVLALSSLATTGPAPASPDIPSVRAGERRQIQFVTSGGTRIIWELNPDFTLGETMP